MKNIILTAIAALFITACSTSESEKFTIICGEVVNADSSSPKVLTVIPCDFINGGDRFAVDISKSDYCFNQKFMMTHKHDVGINYNGKFYTIMAEPRDSIFVTIDAKDNNIRFGGSKERFNTQLNIAMTVADSIYNEVHKFDLNTDVEGVISQLNEKMDLTQNAIKECDVDVIRYVLDNALYVYANHIVSFDRKHECSPERYRLLTDDLFDIHNSEKGHSYMYAMHITNLMRDFMISDPEIREEVFKDEQDIKKLSQLLLSYILQQPESIMRDILLAQSAVMLQQFTDEIEDIYDMRFVDPHNYYNDNFLEFYVRLILEPEESPIGKSIEGDFDIESEVRYIDRYQEVKNLDDINIIDYVVERYKGKVIYIDVWATWCEPCMLEMKYAKDLHKMYENIDDITFVNLCFASKANSWVETIQHNSIGGENYFVASDDAAKMMLSAFKLQGYPSYILIDKDGKFVTTSAYRPSQLDKLSSQLEELF